MHGVANSESCLNPGAGREMRGRRIGDKRKMMAANCWFVRVMTMTIVSGAVS